MDAPPAQRAPGGLLKVVGLGGTVLLVIVVIAAIGFGDGDDPSRADSVAAPATPQSTSAPTAVRTATSTPTPVPEPKTYVVQPGDTLYGIATRFGTTTENLVRLNGIGDAALIEIGQVLTLPLGPEATAGQSDEYQRFLTLLEQGAECPALFEARSGIDKASEDYTLATDDVRSVGCASSAGTRGDPSADGRSPNYVTQYRLSYLQCSFSAAKLYAEAGTREPREAAEWLSEIFVPGDGRDGSTAGCFDALSGLSSRYPE